MRLEFLAMNLLRSTREMATPDTTWTRRRVCRLSRRAATACALSGVAALALAVTGNAFAGGSDPLLSDSSAELPDAAALTAEEPAAAQTGTSDNTFSGTQPDSSTDASSAQPASSGEASSLEAATQQAATAVASATQNNVQNIVVIIRINSPGDDVISQSNTANAGAAATNASTTQQGSGATGPTDRPDSTTSTGAPAAGNAPTAAPAQGEAPATTSVSTPALRVATAAPERARPRVTAVQRPTGDRGGASHRAVGAGQSALAQVGTGSKSNQFAA